jgi:hypothetical protein
MTHGLHQEAIHIKLMVQNGSIALGTNNPNYENYLFTPTCTKPLLVINAGSRSWPYGGASRSMGQALLGIGEDAFGGSVGDYYGIGSGHVSNVGHKYCCETGCVITKTCLGECGDLVFSFRNATGNHDVGTERMRIKAMEI